MKKTVLAAFIYCILCSPSQGMSDDWDEPEAFVVANRNAQLQDDLDASSAVLRFQYPEIVENMNTLAIDASLRDGTLLPHVRDSWDIPLDFYLREGDKYNLDVRTWHKRFFYAKMHRLWLQFRPPPAIPEQE